MTEIFGTLPGPDSGLETRFPENGNGGFVPGVLPSLLPPRLMALSSLCPPPPPQEPGRAYPGGEVPPSGLLHLR